MRAYQAARCERSPARRSRSSWAARTPGSLLLIVVAAAAPRLGAGELDQGRRGRQPAGAAATRPSASRARHNRTHAHTRARHSTVVQLCMYLQAVPVVWDVARGFFFPSREFGMLSILSSHRAVAPVFSR